MNHFDFFGLPLALSVDEAAVRQAYLQNSKKFHPDFHTLATEAEQADMLERSTQNNEAFRTLTDFDQRIQYVLNLKGLLSEEKDTAALSQDFLLDMMDINESLMEMEFEPDSTRYFQLKAAMEAKDLEILTPVRPILMSWKEGDAMEDLLKVKEYFLKRRYLLRIKEKLSKFAPAFKNG